MPLRGKIDKNYAIFMRIIDIRSRKKNGNDILDLDNFP